MSIARQLVSFAIQAGSSDIHLEEGSQIAIRVNSDIRILDNVLSNQDMDHLMKELLEPEKQQYFQQHGDLDTSIGLEGISRIRINAYMANERRCLTLRILPDELPNWQKLGLPQPFIDLSLKHRGLVLCTGPTGSGKSTSLAAFIHCILEQQRRHILTIEDPIEFVHQSHSCLVNQREVGRHTQSFTDALRSALREDPDVVLVGEMRDVETISLALTAAETGHLVFGTLHTSSAAKTIDRIIDVFPSGEKEMVRAMLSESLQGVIAQRLLKRPEGGRVAAYEIMIGTSAIRNLIREAKVPQIYGMIQTGREVGMMTMDQSLENLVSQGVVDRETALALAVDQTKFTQG